ncbi:MAG: hypothetical protein DA328_00260 [Nitrososphaeraceae archaeon]|nr:hypothetical protein [Nitrososphaeraceae archaeon]
MITEGQILARKYFAPTNAQSYDKIVKYTTFGRDSVWKKCIAKKLKDHKSILDLACGTGICSSYISLNRDIKITGVDLTFDYILMAKDKKRYSFLANSIAECLPFKDASFDATISSYLAKYADLSSLTKEIWRVLDNNGTVVFHDFIYPRKEYMKIGWNCYFIILNQIIGRIVKSWSHVFSDLDKVIKNSRWEKDLVKELEKTGFENINTIYQTGETSAIITANKTKR